MFDGQQLGEDIVGLVRGFMDREIAPLKAENEDLKARLKALEDRPMPDVVKGDPGEPGKDGRDGADGKDGAGIIDAFISREGHLIASLSDGTTKDLGEIIGKDGRDGKKGADGKDGFNLEDFDIERGEDNRSIILKFERGDLRHEYELDLKTPGYCGVFKEGTEYRVGDMVTWGGSVWHCDEPTTTKPDAKDSKAWTLAVRRGRDGKDAKPNG